MCVSQSFLLAASWFSTEPGSAIILFRVNLLHLFSEWENFLSADAPDYVMHGGPLISLNILLLLPFLILFEAIFVCLLMKE